MVSAAQHNDLDDLQLSAAQDMGLGFGNEGFDPSNYKVIGDEIIRTPEQEI